MGKPLFNSCCGCQSLGNGSIWAGVGSIILSIAMIIVTFTVRVTFRTIFFDWLPAPIVKIIIVFNFCMTILISGIMIIGAIKRNHYLMLPWVVLGCMLIAGTFLSVIYQGVVFMLDGLWITALVWLIVTLLLSVFFTYMWCVVYSHFTVLREEVRLGKYNRQPYRR